MTTSKYDFQCQQFTRGRGAAKGKRSGVVDRRIRLFAHELAEQFAALQRLAAEVGFQRHTGEALGGAQRLGIGKLTLRQRARSRPVKL